MGTKKIRKVIVLLFILLFTVSLVACSKKQNNTVDDTEKTVYEKDNNKIESSEEIGYYKEMQVNLTGENAGEIMMDIGINSEGEPEYYTSIMESNNSIVNRYVVKAGSVHKQSVEWANKAVQDVGGNVMQFKMGADGQYFLFLQDFISLNPEEKNSTKFITSRIFRDAGNGIDYVEITPNNWNDKDRKLMMGDLTGTMAGIVEISKDATIVYYDSDDLALHGYSTKDQKEIDFTVIHNNIPPRGGLIVPYIKENCIYYFCSSEPKIFSYDLITKEEKTFPCELDLAQGCISVSEEGDIYVANNDGIHCFSSKGTTWETIVPSENKLISSTTDYIKGIAIKDGALKEYYVGLNSKSTYTKHAVTYYQYCKEPIQAITDTLTVYSLRENVSMREAIAKYQYENPQVRINYQVAIPNDSEVVEQDVLRSLSTELLAGKGPDILLLDGLPMKQYIDKGALLELSDFLLPMVKDGTLLSNIANNYMTEDKIYAMPIRYSFLYYVIKEKKETKMETVQDINELAGTLQTPFLQSGSYEDLLRLFVITYYDDFINNQEQMDQNQFTEFLKNVKNISAHVTMTEEPPLNYYLEEIKTKENQQNWYAYRNNSRDQIKSDFYVSTGFADNFQDLSVPFAVIKRLEGNMEMMDRTFIPGGTVSINNATKSKEAAKEFVQYLFSEKAQATNNNDGFPVNANSLEAWSNMEPNPDENAIGDPDGFDVYGLTVEEKRELKKTLLKVSKPVFNNQIVLDMIINESLGYLTGEKNLDEAVNNTINKVNLYLFEQ